MIFNIQRYSTHDGPGIRTVVFLKGCSLRCSWCQNPESCSPHKQVLFDDRLCMENCQLCVGCFSHAINKESEATNQLVIHREKLSQEDYENLSDFCPTKALTVCGYDASIDSLMDQVLKDRVFYDRTGGGITLSGGEPFMQPQLAEEIFQASQKVGLHTAVETCLHVPWKHIERSLPWVDLFLADLKHVEDNIFRQWTGGSAKRVLNNFRQLAKTDKQIIVRIPLIQGFNADEKTIKAMTDFVADEVNAKEIHFLPYHTFGMSKYKMLGEKYYAPETALDAPELLAFAQHYAQEKRLTPVLKG